MSISLPSARSHRRHASARRAAVLLALLLALAFFAASTPAKSDERTNARPALPEPFLLGGIQVNEADHEDWFEALEAHGFNTVQVTDYAMQGDWDSAHLWWDAEAPWVVQEIRGAKRRGLRVVLVLRVAVDHAFERNAFLWHGMIAPTSERQVRAWFARYEQFARRWAEIARAEGVDVLMIGSEMNALASTLPLTAPPTLQEWFLNDRKQADRRVRALEERRLLDARRPDPARPSLAEFTAELDARIAAERAWAQRTTGWRAAEVEALAAARRLASEASIAADAVVEGTGDPESEALRARADAAAADVTALEAGMLSKLDTRRHLLDSLWRDVIASVRQRFDGPIGYAANFDQYHEVGFWDALDVMGVNAYFKLRSQLAPGELNQPLDAARRLDLAAELERGWGAVLDDLAAFRAEHDLDLPLVFTELGYTWRAGSTLEPWADQGFALIPERAPMPSTTGGVPARPVGTEEVAPGSAPAAASDGELPGRLVVWREQPAREVERAMAIEALHRALADPSRPRLSGILYWKLSTHAYHRDIESFLIHAGLNSEDPSLPALRRFRTAPPR